MKKRIITGLTMGEPAGISSEITLKIWKNYRNKLNPFIFFGDSDLLLRTNNLLKYNVPIKRIKKINDAYDIFKNYLPVYEIKLNEKAKFGKPTTKNVSKVLLSIKKCVKFALKKKISCIVTNPVEKSIIKKKNKKFDGHTFYISRITKINKPVMLLTSPKISVVPITQHVSLKNAIKQITKNRIIWTTIKVNKFLIDNFSLSKPKIAITGLNPHAGEKGNFGNEEDKYIKPAIKKLKSSGINITGPYPADTIFNKEIAKSFDVIICMYHDQATIPIKTIDFYNGVNITIGLPIIRTSPDHGTGFDIAGKGKASEKSLFAALIKANEIAQKRKNWTQ